MSGSKGNEPQPFAGRTVAVIGSFRQHYEHVQNAIRIFQEQGLEVKSPAGSNIIQPDIPFVRFETDPSDASDELVQSITLERIFSAVAVFVVAPAGYVGRTTCYEIGRILARRQPIYFSEHPTDLPVRIPQDHVASALEVAQAILRGSIKWPFARAEGRYYDLERALSQ